MYLDFYVYIFARSASGVRKEKEKQSRCNFRVLGLDREGSILDI